MSPYKEFTARFKLLISKNPNLITTTLSNIFTMRLIGNKTHGDLAEIAIAEFINQYMYDFRSIHVGKDLYRAKEHEEDITIINEITKDQFPVSLKAYGDGPLQLSTDKNFLLFPALEAMGKTIEGKDAISKVWESPVFEDFTDKNVLPLIYHEKKQECNILVFDYEKAKKQVTKIVFEAAVEDKIGVKKKGKGRIHPVYRFYDKDGEYVFEVRYGSGTANALQRGLWTHTKNGFKYFDSVTDGWIAYAHNTLLVKVFSHALISSSIGHQAALVELVRDIEQQKSNQVRY
jgi:hypothetical protein